MEDNVNSINNIFGLICDTSSESIISIDSLLTSLNHICSYESFLQYKTHLLHTMNDIKDSLQYINDLSYRQIHHTQSEPSCDNTPKTQLEFTSKSLGLKYNYDEYLSKMFPVNNQSPNLPVDTSGLAYNYELLPKATSSVQRNYEYVPKEKQISQREREHSVVNNDNNSNNNNNVNNKQYQQASAPSQMPSTSVTGGVNHNNSNNENNNNNEQDKENTSTPQQQQQQQSPNIVQDLPPTPKQQRPNTVIIKQNIINPKKKKVARVTDLVTKINSDQELYDLTVQLFGENILDKLMSLTTEEIFIENVEKTVEEIERLRSNDTESSNINNNNNPKLSSQRIPIKHSLRNQLLNPSHTPKEDNTNINVYQELPDTKPSQDEEATRAYADELLAKSGLLERFPKTPQSAVSKSVKGKEKKKQVITGYKNSGEMYYHPKIFMNYMSQYGQYFDSSLQNGGSSKLPPYDKRKNRKVVSPVRKYIYSASNKENNA